MIIHMDRMSGSTLESRDNALGDPCDDLEHVNQHKRQARVQRHYLILVIVNILVVALLLTSIALDRYYNDRAPVSSSVEIALGDDDTIKASAQPLTQNARPSTTPPKAEVVAISPGSLSLVDEEKSLIKLYETAGPAAVKIVVAQRGTVDITRAEPRGDGSGSGIILDLEGHIVTNNHVVDKASDVVVQLGNGHVVKAEVLGQDPTTDLAVLNIDVPEEELATVPFADSDALRVGQLAIAIGHPFGFEKSLTVGHISGLDRIMPTKDKYIPLIQGMIQTDAAINPGNSGGPLFNLQGEVVGINTAIFSTSRGSQGIGFAIPSNTVRQVTTELIEKGYVSRPFLGVFGISLNEARATRLGLEVQQGVLIQDVSKDSGAWQAGLRRGERRVWLEGLPARAGGDVLVALDGQAVDSMRTLSKLLQDYAIGDTITLSVVRDGEEIELEAILNEQPHQVDEDPDS